MIKRGKEVVIFLIVLSIAIIPLASAGFFDDIYKKITGKATSDTTALNITIGNSAPTITYVQIITSKNPTDDSTTTITFNFTVTDTDGAGNIDTTSGKAYFQKAGETTRSDLSCSNYDGVGDNMNFSCTIDMWYFDENGDWTINTTAKDINEASAENSSQTFTYNLLPGMKMAPTSLDWDSVGLTDTDTGSNNDPVIINNTGNDNALTIDVTSYDLEGEDTKTDYIFAENFTIGITSQGCSGTAMVNETATEVGSAILNRGNHSINDGSTGQEEIFSCLKGVPQDISAQSYSSAAFGPWTIEIVS